MSSALRWCILVRGGPGDTRTSERGTPVAADWSRRTKAHGALIRSIMDRRSDITLKEIRAKLAKVSVSVGIVTICRFFQRHRLTLNKGRPMLPGENRPDRLKQRWAWFETQPDL